MTFVTLTNINKQIGDACGRAIAAMEKADLTCGPELTNAASRAYRTFFNGLISEQDYGPDAPIEWAMRSTRAVVLIRELAGEYRMLSETSEEYDTQQCLRQVAIALNTVANEIEDLRPEAEPEPELEPEDVSTKCDTSLIDYDLNIQSAYREAMEAACELATLFDDLEEHKERRKQYINLLARTCLDSSLNLEDEAAIRRQLIVSAAIVRGVAREYYEIYLVVPGGLRACRYNDAHKAAHKLADAIAGAISNRKTAHH